MGAKNHAILMPDGQKFQHPLFVTSLKVAFPLANKNFAINSIIGAAFGGRVFISHFYLK